LHGCAQFLVHLQGKVAELQQIANELARSLPLSTPLDVWLVQIERFAKEVMPAFR
jgi:hypothetical protein